MFSRLTTVTGNLQAASRVKACVWRNTHEKNNALVCGCCNLWQCHSDRSFCDADRAGRDRSCGENRASTLGLWGLWPLLVAPELPPWLPQLRVLPAAPLLAPSLLVVIVGAEETTSPRPLFFSAIIPRARVYKNSKTTGYAMMRCAVQCPLLEADSRIKRKPRTSSKD